MWWNASAIPALLVGQEAEAAELPLKLMGQLVLEPATEIRKNLPQKQAGREEVTLESCLTLGMAPHLSTPQTYQTHTHRPKQKTEVGPGERT